MLLAELTNELDADARLLRDARSRGHDDGCGLEPRDLGHRERVVALHSDRRAELAQVLHEVERERVVVVDDEHLTTQRRAQAFASSTARIWAATLLSISTVSSRCRRVGDDTRGSLHVGDALADDDGAQRDRGVEIAAVAHITDRPRVRTADLGLQLRDDLHRPDLRRPGDGAGGKAGAQRVERRRGR